MMFSKNRDEAVEQVKERARQEMEAERLRLERERDKLDQERDRLDELRSELDRRESKLEDLEERIEEMEEELGEHEDVLEDAESVREILTVVGEKIPSLMRGIDEALISPEAMKKKAESLAIYYKTLVDAGMDKEMAEQMAMIQSSEMNRMVRGYRDHGHGIHIRPAYPRKVRTPMPPQTPPGHDSDLPTTATDE